MIYRIRSYHGGLGDELQFSTFPRLLQESNRDNQIWLYSEEKPKHVLPFRNEGIAKFVWGLNPYVLMEKNDGGEWNLGDIPGIKYENKTGDFIKNWEIAFGLKPENSLPEIYYRPVKIVVKPVMHSA